MQTLWQDIRYGFRGMRSTAGFTALAMITLGLGIGAERIVAFSIHNLDNARPGGRQALKPREYLAFRQQNHVFEEDTGGGNEDVLLTTTQGTEQFDGEYV